MSLTCHWNDLYRENALKEIFSKVHHLYFATCLQNRFAMTRCVMKLLLLLSHYGYASAPCWMIDANPNGRFAVKSPSRHFPK